MCWDKRDICSTYYQDYYRATAIKNTGFDARINLFMK